MKSASSPEGQISAVEQATGRLLWRRCFPGVHLNGKLIVPQAGIEGSWMRCLDAATGDLIWEAPFTSCFNKGYACTRFTCSGTYVLGANMDLIDISKDGEIVSTGPALDSRECVGSVVSNGRLFYTSQDSRLQVSQVPAGGVEGSRPNRCLLDRLPFVIHCFTQR